MIKYLIGKNIYVLNRSSWNQSNRIRIRYSVAVKVDQIWLREEDLAGNEVNSRSDGKRDIPHVFNTKSFPLIKNLKGYHVLGKTMRWTMSQNNKQTQFYFRMCTKQGAIPYLAGHKECVGLLKILVIFLWFGCKEFSLYFSIKFQKVNMIYR